MTSSRMRAVALYLFSLCCCSLLATEIATEIATEKTGGGLDISADHTTANLKTEISRLEGNVSLKHNNLIISGDAAEVQPASDKLPQQFIISGAPVHFKQMLENNELVASALQIIYLPALQRMELQNKVYISQTITENQFDIQADQLKVEFKIGKPYLLVGTGNPLTFSQQLQQRKIQILADEIVWEAEEQIAILKKAKVLDEQTSFAAEELKYNTLTGEITAIGSGETRPSYRFNPEHSKESNKKESNKKESKKSNDS